jgi:hypothetical protein
MNKEFILSDLEEAKKELEQMIREIESDANFDFDGYCVEMQHIYYHINKAWNLRKEDEENIRNCSKKDFFEWSKFPKDFKL